MSNESKNHDSSTEHRDASKSTQRTDNVDRNIDSRERAIPIIEEELQVGKREVEGGGVRVHTQVTEKPVEEQVTLREEHVNVERHPVDRAVTDADLAAVREGEINVKTRGEEAIVSKQAKVVEEVTIGKNVTEREETVRDTVKRTDVDVEEIDTRTDRNTDANTHNRNNG